jgi:hypothetical protein
MMADNDFPSAIGFLQSYAKGMEDYQQSGDDIDDLHLQSKYIRGFGGPLVQETLISGSPSFDLSVPDTPALGPETPDSMRRRQLEMLLPGHELRRRSAGEKYNKIFPFRGA